MADHFLTLNEVSKTINKKLVVAPLQLTLGQGKTLALCGANGAGKSTLIRMIAGVTTPTSGTITLNGLQWKNERKAYAEQIGYMPDDFRFGTALSAWETTCFYASLHNVRKERVEEVLHMVGLYEVRGQSIQTFSKGMRQRLMFAQAILAMPPLLIMDEPTNGLDPFWMKRFVDLLQQLQAQGMTIIFSTHQLHIAEETADEVVFLHEGRVINEGSVEYFVDKMGPSALDKVYNEGVISD